MKTLIGLSLAAIAAAAVAGCTADQAQVASVGGGSATCFEARDIHTWQEEGTASVLFKLDNGDTWRGNLLEPCRDLDRATRINLASRAARSFLCNGDDGVLQVIGSSTGTNTCEMKRFAKLSPAEVAAVPRRPVP